MNCTNCGHEIPNPRRGTRNLKKELANKIAVKLGLSREIETRLWWGQLSQGALQEIWDRLQMITDRAEPKGKG